MFQEHFIYVLKTFEKRFQNILKTVQKFVLKRSVNVKNVLKTFIER